jgi:4-alpha-glucanotransferase
MSSLHLVLGSYNSQALDLVNTDRDALYEYSYKPFLKLLYNYEATPFTMYYSGLLIEWLEKHHSEFVDVLTEMVKRKQVELLGGAFFEPILPLIPKTDRIGQIERLTTHIRKCFGRRPRGAWIPESIWDQRIAANLNAGGLEYAFLQDGSVHFGPPGAASRGRRPVLTEDQGKTLTLLPLSRSIGDRLFIDSPEDVLETLKGIAGNAVDGSGPALVSLIFDGSRLGYRKEESEAAVEWYTRFLDLLTANRDWISINLPHRILRDRNPLRRAYAPVSTLSELTDWMRPFADDSSDAGEVAGEGTPLPAGTGPATDQGRSSFRSIMEEYPECARLYARMQHTHVLVNQVRGDKYRKMTAREELWRGQSHYAYWNNRTGGIYRSSLRKATYSALIEAEKTTRERGIFIPALSRLDVDLDGEEEILYQGNEINAYLDRRGGCLFELDYLPKNWNYLDTFQRRPEPFHDAASRTAGYDSWPRAAFVDHLFRAGQDLPSFAAGRRDIVCDVSGIEYEVEHLDKDHNAVAFRTVCYTDDGLGEIEIRKVYRFVKNRVDLEYRLRNNGMETISAVFGTEINLSFESLDVGKLRLHVRQGRSRKEIPPDAVALEGITDFQFQDLHNNTLVTLSPSERPDLWCFPVEAVGILWDHPHWFYQSNCSVLRWPVDLKPGDTVERTISLKIEPAR